MHVHVVGIDRQRVAGRSHHHQIAGTKALAKLGYEALQRVRHPCRRIVLPQRLDELIGRHHPSAAEGQHRQEGARLRTLHRQRTAALARRFQRTEEANLHRAHRTDSAQGQRPVSALVDPARMSRRDRQRAELLTLCLTGPVARAVDLAFGHLAEFGRDDDLLDRMEDALERRGVTSTVRGRFDELRRTRG